jgi:hypothetical protein
MQQTCAWGFIPGRKNAKTTTTAAMRFAEKLFGKSIFDDGFVQVQEQNTY